MLEETRNVRLDSEEIDGFRIDGQLRRKPLEGDHLAGARSFGDARLVHLGHAAASEELQDLEPPESRRLLVFFL